jgi:hypothetical protein
VGFGRLHRTPPLSLSDAGEKSRQETSRGPRLVAGTAGRGTRGSRQTVNAIENGRYDPSLPLAFTIAALFKLRIEEIFTP